MILFAVLTVSAFSHIAVLSSVKSYWSLFSTLSFTWIIYLFVLAGSSRISQRSNLDTSGAS